MWSLKAFILLLIQVGFLHLPPVLCINETIHSPWITYWGDWGPWEYCPEARFVHGFQLKTQPHDDNIDNTALNGIRLFCGDPDNPNVKTITSTVGSQGNWGKVFNCFPGVIHGFSLRVQKDVVHGDNTATNNAMFHCLDKPNDMIMGDGLDGGEWNWRGTHCKGNNRGICGIQTQVQAYKENQDNTALNNIKVQCCDVDAAPIITEPSRREVE